MIGHHAVIGATARVGGSAAWHPTDEPTVIEFGDTTTMRDAGGAAPDVGEVVETWLSAGSVGTLTMTRQAGAPVLALSNGRPYLALPALGANGPVFTFATKDLVGTELWVLARKNVSGTTFFLTDGISGSAYQILKGNTVFRLGGTSVTYSTPLSGFANNEWGVVRFQLRSDGAFQQLNGDTPTVLTGSQAAFQVGAMGRRLDPNLSEFDIASYVTVYGTADAALEANLYAWMGAERDRLNGAA